MIAHTNIGRVPLAQEFGWSLSRDVYDAELTIYLSADAIPAVIDRFADIPTDQQPLVRNWLCGSGRRRVSGLGWTLSAARADDALTRFLASADRRPAWIEVA